MMLIPIPIGVKRAVAVEGAVWKFVSCWQCQERYAYLMQLEAIGESDDLLFLDAEGSARRAQAQAEQNLSKMSQNVVLPVPCPNCGHYQDDMVRILKEEESSNLPMIAGLIVACLALALLAFNIPYGWVLTVAGVVAGVCLVAYGDMAASRFNPNAGDAEPRKARGRKHAVWGAQLADLLAANRDVPSTAIIDKSRDSTDHIKPA